MTLKRTRAKTKKPISRRPIELRHKRPLHKRTVEPTIRKHWDRNKTVKQNITSIPLDAFAERLPTAEEHDGKLTKNLSEPDAKLIKRLLQKYGRDGTDKMARDIKLNKWQWTASKLTKMIAKYEAGFIAKPIGA